MYIITHYFLQVNSNNTTCSTHNEVVDYIKNSNSSVLTLKLIRPSKLPPGIQDSPSSNGSPNRAIMNSSSLSDHRPVTSTPEPASERLTHSPILQRLSKESEWDSSEEDQPETTETGDYSMDEPPNIRSSPTSKPAATSQHYSDSRHPWSAQHPKAASIQPPYSTQSVPTASTPPRNSTPMGSQPPALDKLPRFQDTRASEYDRVAQKLQSRKVSQPPPPKPLALDVSSDEDDSNLSAFGKAVRRASLQRTARMDQNKPRFTKANGRVASPQTSSSNKAAPTKGLESSSTDSIDSPIVPKADVVDINHVWEAPHPDHDAQSNAKPSSPLQESSSAQQDSVSEEEKVKGTAELPGDVVVENEIKDKDAEAAAQKSQEFL